MMLNRFFFIVVIFLFTITIIGCGKSENAQSQLMLNEILNCPEGSKGEYNRWGGVDSSGWAHSCKMLHGKYHVWKGNVLVIEGQFYYGKKEGKWIYRNNKGKTLETIIY